MVLGATLMMPNAAMAACSDGSGPGHTYHCNDTTTGSQTFTATEDDWLAWMHNDPSNASIDPGYLTIDNTDDEDGEFRMDSGTSINTTSGGPAFLLQNGTPVDSTVTLTLNGSITSSVNSGVGGDALRLQGYDLVVNVGEGGTVTGNDDGFRFLSGHHVQLTNYGTITGQGDVFGDDGFGIEYNGQGGNSNGGWNRLTGAVDINNYGDIHGDDRDIAGHRRGAGIEVSTTGETNILNGEDGVIDGYRGIWVEQGTDGGAVGVINHGHIEGTFGAGVDIATEDGAYFKNDSYMSVLGTDGLQIDPAGQALVDNEGGLTAGTINGAYIANIHGEGLDLDGNVIDNYQSSPTDNNPNAVDIDNRAGIFAGGENGISISTVDGIYSSTEGGDAVDIYINNAASLDYWENEDDPVWNPGGLIAGVNNDGITVNDANGDLEIDNRLTWEGSIDLTAIDPAVYDETESSGLIYGQLPDYYPKTFNNGIYGGEDGIDANAVDGYVGIANEDGRIVGAEGDGIQLSNVATVRGQVFIDNGIQWVGDNEDEAVYGGGTIWGGEDGINIATAGNGGTAAILNNTYGEVFGKFDGVVASNIDGDVLVFNEGGLIEGYWGDAIDVATSGSDDKVGIYNTGAYEGGIGFSEGHIIAADTAINVDTDFAFVLNESDGIIIGDGEDGSVMNFVTSTFSEGSSAGAVVLNGGIMTSQRNPNFDRGFGPAVAIEEFPTYDLDTQAIYNDTDNIANFAWSGGAYGSIEDLDNGLTINDYLETASDLLITSESGALVVANVDLYNIFVNKIEESESYPHAVMFGRIQADGATESGWWDSESSQWDWSQNGNTVVNLGQWFVTNEGGIDSLEAGTILDGNYDDSIYNAGLIQTAFQTEGGDFTSFKVDDFYNGGSGGEDFGPYSEDYGYGLLSMIDGDSEDTTLIEGNFHGGDNDWTHSYLGVDVNFAPTSEGGESDILQIGGYYGPYDSGFEVTGSTGIIAHKLNDNPDQFTQVGDRIPVVYAYTGDDSGDFTCEDEWCEEGDSFFVSDYSPDYINVGGVGFIRDGMFMWGLQERDVPYDPETDWVATWGPDAVDQAAVVSTLQTAWYDTSGYVEDHVYGNTYPVPGGGAGADLPSADMASAAPDTGGTQRAIWGRITGTWASRDTSINENPPDVTVDTSLNQNTYSVVGGLEFRPDNGGNENRFGIYAGYLNSSVTFDSYGGKSHASGAIVGGYAALIKGPWYLDGEVKADIVSVDYTSPGVSVDTNGVTVGVLANTGYRMDNGKAFIEPIASFAYAKTFLGDADGGGGTSIDFDGQSIRAGVGARVGATFGTPGNTQTELDVLGKIWDEFGGGNSVMVSDGSDTTTFTDNMSGVFGEVVGRATVYNADRSASGFLSIGGKFGSSSTDISAKAGLRKNF